MNTHQKMIVSGLFLLSLAGCKKEDSAPPPVVTEVTAPVKAVVAPGMELENPAEKEGRP